MNILESHILSRLAAKRHVPAAEFPNCAGTLALLIQDGCIERQSGELGDVIRITDKGLQQSVDSRAAGSS
ncbi:hypothetical protein [Pseudooceanicola atlanticus]|jgi:hypothetical protein|uniref:Uncharacterized protein n=1 Tax=Pseudooceanicola atlanticus TaxID=1461694 RepID=A0A0A0EFR7_9RHOB|nr:hypothetical protein [Pseudooceanicola atlanticus]KGM48923.1 hypothetical protein ATO9_09485 [Pseudooceanicola atlanticus]